MHPCRCFVFMCTVVSYQTRLPLTGRTMPTHRQDMGDDSNDDADERRGTVSYTHLTLPTILLV
eukprot:7141523-Pyramimonas_sp.AAC.1